jgi:hypothetical protein
LHYSIRRIKIGSALRMGCALAWAAALVPASCLAWAGLAILQRFDQALDRVEPLTLSVLGQEIARIDVLAILRLQPAVQAIDRLAAGGITTFLTLALLLALAGGLVLLAAWLLLVFGYNLLGRYGLGLEVEVQEN